MKSEINIFSQKIARENNALVVTGHDPDAWRTFKKAPMLYYD